MIFKNFTIYLSGNPYDFVIPKESQQTRATYEIPTE